MASNSATEQNRLSARERILVCAHDLFYRHGIRATGIDRIIETSGVTKVTFYRHFPSKNALILAFLDYRHQRWMDWFNAALQRHGGAGKGLAALPPALAEWFASETYRGCAFINTTVELGSDIPEVVTISRQHKAEMTASIAALMADAPGRELDAQVIAMVVDGAILRAQFDQSPAAALKLLNRLLEPYLPRS